MTNATELMNILGNTNENTAKVRASNLRLFPACGRCLGSGKYSFNGAHSNCYGCGGSGSREPANEMEWEAAIEAAHACVADGRLAQYMDAIEARNAIKGATDKVMAAWKAIGFDYKWQFAARWHKEPSAEYLRHREISDINKKCADAFEVVMNIHIYPKSATVYQDYIVAAAKLNLALATVAAARCEYLLYLAQNPK